MGTTTRRTQADALDAIAAEMRLANQIEALRLGTAALDHVDTAGKTEATAARQARLNVIRADIRRTLGLEVTS